MVLMGTRCPGIPWDVLRLLRCPSLAPAVSAYLEKRAVPVAVQWCSEDYHVPLATPPFDANG